MIDRTARLRSICGAEHLLPCSRRLRKGQAHKRSRRAGRDEIRQQLDTLNDFKDESVWTVLSPCSGKFRNTVWVIEGDEDIAVRVYAARNDGRHPGKVSCDCGCGPDYFIDQFTGTIEEATARERNCVITVRHGREVIVDGVRRDNPSRWDFQLMEQFLARTDVIVIRKSDIQSHEANRPLPVATNLELFSPDLQTIAWLLDAEI